MDEYQGNPECEWLRNPYQVVECVSLASTKKKSQPLNTFVRNLS